MKFLERNPWKAFLVMLEIFLHTLIVLIIIGVDIIHHERFLKEWIELLNHIYGRRKIFFY